MKDNINKSKKFMIIGISVLVLAIAGATYAYYAASATANIEGHAAGAGMEITVNKLSTAADKDLVPLYNTPEMLTKAAKGNGNTGNTFDASKSCIDKNGNTACQVYEITLTNTGNAPLTLNGGVSLFGANTPNINCAVMTDEVTVESNASCKGKTTLADGVTINAGASEKYYIVVYIENKNEEQNDSGAFSGTITFTSTAGGKLKAKFAEDINAVEYVTELYNSNKGATPITNNNIDYYYANIYDNDADASSSGGLMNDRLGGQESLASGIGNIRYYGASPNNYVDFGDKYTENEEIENWVLAYSKYYGDYNFTRKVLEEESGITDSASCLALTTEAEVTDAELQEEFGMTISEFCSTSTIHEVGDPIPWRIVGVFDGKLKVVRDESIGDYAWDVSDSLVNNGRGVNQWGESTYISDGSPYEGADLMRLLNPGYETSGESLYWNGSVGTCSGVNIYTEEFETGTCDFTNVGLSNEAKDLIEEVIWNTGLVADNWLSIEELYSEERGNTVITNLRDGIKRQTTWRGKVGLLYSSDYYYATSSTNYNFWDGSFAQNDYLFNGEYYWLMTSFDFTESNGIVVLYDGKFSGDAHLNSKVGVRPVVYLNSDTLIDGGTGTKDDPYVLSL